MRSSQRSKLAALIVFVLIAGGVVGGMAWATVATVQLAELNVTQEYRGQVLRAVTLMDSHLQGILNSESARPYTAYGPYYTPAAIWRFDGQRLRQAEYRLQSPLVNARYDWLEIDFHVEGGRWRSPQIPDDSGPLPISTVTPLEPDQRRLQQMLDWLSTVLPAAELPERVARALERQRLWSGEEPATVDDGEVPVTMSEEVLLASQASVDAEFQKRLKGQWESQSGYLPSERCDTPEGVNVELSSLVDDTPVYATPVSAADPIAVSVERFGPPVWLESPSDDRLKLVFIRQGQKDERVFHQGFMGDWGKLKATLLEQINHLFAEADLEPIRDDADASAEMSEARMTRLDARLRVPDIPGGATAAAWGSVRTKLMGTWFAAAAVLFVAGLGLRNLVALTERRMQFAYAVTHELRTPLTTVRLYSDMLSAGLVPEESKQDYLDALNRESLRLSDLVTGVLEYSRLENQKVKLNSTDTDGAALLALVSETLTKRCAEDGLDARTENGVGGTQRLRTDIDVVNRIVSVLIANACRHARGGDNATVLARLAVEGGNVHVDIIDSGPGIDRADTRAIFKPFRRGRKADESAQGGIGLGLALASSWARLLGGRLELAARHHSELGGAHFRLTIPNQIKS